MAYFSFDDPASLERLQAFAGPGFADQLVRQAISAAWMMLPADRKSADEVERVIRQLVDRALKDFREDAEAFGRARPRDSERQV